LNDRDICRKLKGFRAILSDPSLKAEIGIVLRHSGRELEECTVVRAFSILLAKGGLLCGSSEVGCGDGWRMFLHGAARTFDIDGQRSVVTDAMFGRASDAWNAMTKRIRRPLAAQQ